MSDSQYLQHYGIPKMRWGIRRFQNEDGSLTEEGRKRYGKEKKSKIKAEQKEPPKPLTNEEIVNSGDPNVVLANVSRLSTQEIQAAKNRIQEINNIKNLSMGEIRKKKENVLKRGAKLIGKAIAEQTADSVTKVTKGVTSYAIKKTVKKTLPDNWEWKGVIVSALSGNDGNKNNNQNQNQNQNNQGKKDQKQDKNNKEDKK